MIIGLCGIAGSGKSFIADIIQKKYNYQVIALADPIKRICQDVFGFSYTQLWGPSHERNKPDLRYPRKCKNCNGEGVVLNYTLDELTSYSACEICSGSKETHLSPREALQSFGTSAGRECYENIWTEYTIKTAKELMAGKSITFQWLDGEETKQVWYDYLPNVGITNSREISQPSGVLISDVRFYNEMLAIKKNSGKIVKIIRDAPSTLNGVLSQHSSETEQSKIPNSEFDAILYNDKDLNVLEKSIEETLFKLSR